MKKPAALNHLSYSNTEFLSTQVSSPSSVDELKQILAASKHCTIVGSAMSFDRQVHGEHLICLKNFNDFKLDKINKTLKVGAGLEWGTIVQRCMKEGFVPPILVSHTKATPGGTAGFNSLSRFSTYKGKEGIFILELELMLANGHIVTASRHHNTDLFYATIGGLGSLAIILTVTYQLEIFLPETCMVTRGLRHYETHSLEDNLIPKENDSFTRYALVVHTKKGLGYVLWMSSLKGKSKPKNRLLAYQPYAWWRVPFEVLTHTFPKLSDLFWKYGMEFLINEKKNHIDPFFDSTFFEDGNSRTRDFCNRYSIPFFVMQQSYIIAKGRLEDFLRMTELVHAHQGISPRMIDAIYLPDDEPFLLSSTRSLSGFCVTITHTRAFDLSQKDKIINTYKELSDYCFQLGGRVHLVKNIFAKKATMHKMYAEELEELKKLKQKYDPQNRFSSHFFKERLNMDFAAKS